MKKERNNGQRAKDPRPYFFFSLVFLWYSVCVCSHCCLPHRNVLRRNARSRLQKTINSVLVYNTMRHPLFLFPSSFCLFVFSIKTMGSLQLACFVFVLFSLSGEQTKGSALEEHYLYGGCFPFSAAWPPQQETRSNKPCRWEQRQAAVQNR